MSFFKKARLTQKDVMDRGEVLAKFKNRPTLIYLKKISNDIYSTGKTHGYTLLTHKKVKTYGEGINIIISKREAEYLRMRSLYDTARQETPKF